MAALPHLDTVIRLGAAAGLGSIVGFERERLLWSAGIRTHMMVCVGACLFMLVSAYGFASSLGGDHTVLDPSRVAAQVVSGIGFLGAGAILAKGEVVRGLTTAASIWAVAAIGLAVGGGMYFEAAVSTVVIIVILAGVKPLEQAYRDRNQTCRLSLRADHGAVTPETIRRALGIRPGQIKRFLAQAKDQGAYDDIVVVIARVSARDLSAIGARLGDLPGVSQVDLVTRSQRTEPEAD